jgi:hypothetical protein
LTQRFFLTGEEQEASGYAGVVLDDVPVPPDAEFDSFDKIPRKRRSLFAVVAVASMIALGALTWKPFRALWRGNTWVNAASRAMVRPDPAPAARMTPPAAPFTTGVAGGAAKAPPENTGEATSTEPAAELDDPPLAPAEENQAVQATDEPDGGGKAPEVPDPGLKESIKRHRSQALRGYVWSPAAKALVPAHRAAEEPGPTLDHRPPEPNGAREEEPKVAPENTSPPPFKPKPTPKPAPNGAPILD